MIDYKLHYEEVKFIPKAFVRGLWTPKELLMFLLTLLSFLAVASPMRVEADAHTFKSDPIIKLSRTTPLKPYKAVKHSLPSLKHAEAIPKPKPVTKPLVASGVTNCGDNLYKQFVYQHESGCRTDAVAPNGACGLGQAWPCSKMPCSLSDFACQDAFFSQYAIDTYGGWPQAMNAWQSKSWW